MGKSTPIHVFNSQSIKRIAYLSVLILIIYFLYQLGPAPWITAAQRWPVLLCIILTTGLGVIVQALSFICSVPIGTEPPPPILTTKIWAFSAVVSVVAPVFAGFATRIALLQKNGTPASVCILSSGRQAWMGLETTMLIGCCAAPFLTIPYSVHSALALALAWITMVALRRHTKTSGQSPTYSSKWKQAAYYLRSPFRTHSYLYFAMQILLMSATYFLAFRGFGASVSLMDAIGLAVATVLVSLIAFIPNGLGILDGIWIYTATTSGITLEASVSLAILIRLGHFLGATIVLILSTAYSKNAHQCN